MYPSVAVTAAAYYYYMNDNCRYILHKANQKTKQNETKRNEKQRGKEKREKLTSFAVLDSKKVVRWAKFSFRWARKMARVVRSTANRLERSVAKLNY